MAEIVPAILTADRAELQRQLEQVRGIAPMVQIDIVDGVFAPRATWPLTEDGELEQSGLQRMLPYQAEFSFQFDLMVDHPGEVMPKFAGLGASVVLHAASPCAKATLERERSDERRGYYAAMGVALLPSMSVEALVEFMPLIEFVQVMGIDEVGAQGQPFDERSVTLIRAIRAAYPQLPIQVDGGVNRERVPQFVEAGATRLVAGSAIFTSPDPRAAYQELRAAG